MSVRFFITPYDPATWKDENAHIEKPTSDLSIDVSKYAQELRKRWPNAEIHLTVVDDDLTYLLDWRLPPESGVSGLPGQLQNDHQVVSFGTGPKDSFLDFILWHRAFVPSYYQLFLFNSSSWNSLELKMDTTKRDIGSFVGIVE